MAKLGSIQANSNRKKYIYIKEHLKSDSYVRAVKLYRTVVKRLIDSMVHEEDYSESLKIELLERISLAY